MGSTIKHDQIYLTIYAFKYVFNLLTHLTYLCVYIIFIMLIMCNANDAFTHIQIILITRIYTNYSHARNL